MITLSPSTAEFIKGLKRIGTVAGAVPPDQVGNSNPHDWLFVEADIGFGFYSAFLVKWEDGDWVEYDEIVAFNGRSDGATLVVGERTTGTRFGVTDDGLDIYACNDCCDGTPIERSWYCLEEPVITGDCTPCPEPCWRVTFSGISTDPDYPACQCTNYNTTFVLPHDEAHSPFPGANRCIWGMDVNIGCAPRHISMFLNDYNHLLQPIPSWLFYVASHYNGSFYTDSDAIYELEASQWDCNGTNVMSLVYTSDDPVCSGWANTLAVTAVDCSNPGNPLSSNTTCHYVSAVELQALLDQDYTQVSGPHDTEEECTEACESLWYCLENDGSQDCYLLRPDELADYEGLGYTVESGPHEEAADCLIECNSSGPGEEECEFCSDPIPETVCLKAADAGLTNGSWDSCVALNEDTTLTFVDNCTYESGEVVGDPKTGKWVLEKIDATTWNLALRDVDDGMPMGPIYSITVAEGNCTFPITLTHGGFAEGDCDDWPEELTVNVDCVDCHNCGAADLPEAITFVTGALFDDDCDDCSLISGEISLTRLAGFECAWRSAYFGLCGSTPGEYYFEMRKFTTNVMRMGFYHVSTGGGLITTHKLWSVETDPDDCTFPMTLNHEAGGSDSTCGGWLTDIVVESA